MKSERSLPGLQLTGFKTVAEDSQKGQGLSYRHASFGVQNLAFQPAPDDPTTNATNAKLCVPFSTQRHQRLASGLSCRTFPLNQLSNPKPSPGLVLKDFPIDLTLEPRGTTSGTSLAVPLARASLATAAPASATIDRKPGEQSNNERSCWRWASKTCNGMFRLPCCPVRGRALRLASIWLLLLAAWGTAVMIVGADAVPPSGHLWQLFILTVLAKAGGWVAVQMRLPGLLGMLLVGMGLQSLGFVQVEGPYLGLIRLVRKASLVIIMMRAGLDLDPLAVRRLRFTILRMGVLPWLLETCCVAGMAILLFQLSISWAFMLGVVETAVSPAVVVPSLILLRQRGFGVAKGVPTLVLAVTGIEDAIAISAFGVIASLMFSSSSLTISIVMGLGSVLLGIGSGLVIGLICRFIPDRTDPYAISLRVFMLLLGGLVAVLGSDRLSMGGGGPLAVIVMAFVAGSGWTTQGWKTGENQVALIFGVIWQYFEPAVFGLVGAQIRVVELPANTVGLAAACILGPALVRFVFTLTLQCGSCLNLKEKFFVALSWMAKATVQAVLGPAALDLVRGNSDKEAQESARVMFVVCVLAILLTAPVGAVLIATTGPRLLKKQETSPPPPPPVPALMTPTPPANPDDLPPSAIR